MREPSHDDNIDVSAEDKENASTQETCDNNTPEDVQFSVEKCDKCEQYSRRLEQAQDSCRKVKKRQYILPVEVRQLRKMNKQMQKV